MPSIAGKRQGNQTYYYLVESARVEGKPRIVSQQYLGSAEEVMAKLAGQPSGEAVRSKHKKFGDLAAVWSVLQRLDVAGVVDAVVPRRADAAASVGTYMALATANRIVDPCSKAAFAHWWATTAGPRWVKLPEAALDHRRFWDAMDVLSQADLAAIETELGRRMVTEFGLDLSGLVLDMTNFATFIDSANERAPIAQRGKAKQKRTDLRLVGLALIVTRDGGVPIVSHPLPPRPARRDPVPHRGGEPDGPLPAAGGPGRVVDSGLRRGPELHRQPQRGRGQRGRVRRLVAGFGPPRRLEQRLFGKRILFTNREHWTVDDVVAAYRSQSEVEAGFRQLKDPHVVSFSPTHHWTDSKIRVHVFHCVLALAIAHLMRREADNAGLHMSVRELLNTLAGIGETVLLYHDGGKGRPRARRMITDMDPTQQRLADLFAINRFAPTR